MLTPGGIDRNSTTSKPMRLLHSLSVSNDHFDSINMNFIGPLLKDEGYDMLMTVTDQLGSTNICLILCHTTISLLHFVTCVTITHDITFFFIISTIYYTVHVGRLW